MHVETAGILAQPAPRSATVTHTRARARGSAASRGWARLVATTDDSGEDALLNRLRVPLLLKYFVGVALVQGMTVLLMYAWWHTGSADAGLTLAALGLGMGMFAALWLSSIARGDRTEALTRAQADLARERERHKRLTAQERAKAEEGARRQVQRETQKLKTRSGIRLGGAVAGMAGLGTLLLLTQFMSLGILLLSSSGGALAGYLLRARQELRRQGAPESSALIRTVVGTRLLDGHPERAAGETPPPSDRNPRS
jgi:hypothetical protein